jgi:hypothetical protein
MDASIGAMPTGAAFYNTLAGVHKRDPVKALIKDTVRCTYRPFRERYQFTARDSCSNRDEIVPVSTAHSAALQGFPPTYVWPAGVTARARCIGNAVPPPLARCVASAVRAAAARREKNKKKESKSHPFFSWRTVDAHAPPQRPALDEERPASRDHHTARSAAVAVALGVGPHQGAAMCEGVRDADEAFRAHLGAGKQDAGPKVEADADHDVLGHVRELALRRTDHDHRDAARARRMREHQRAARDARRDDRGRGVPLNGRRPV